MTGSTSVDRRRRERNRELALDWLDRVVDGIDEARGLDYGLPSSHEKKALSEMKRAANEFRVRLKKRHFEGRSRVNSAELEAELERTEGGSR